MSIRDNMIQQVLGNPGKYSIQQLEAAMKSGSLPAYVVVPIIQDKVQQQKQMQAAMMMQQQPVNQQPPIAEQVMQEAGQMGGGVEQLPSNLPQEYAGGGIVAFAPGGDVDGYADDPAADIGSSPYGMGELGMAGFEAPENVRKPRTPQELAQVLQAYKDANIPLGRNDIQDIALGIKGMPPPAKMPAPAAATPAAKPPVAPAGPGAGGPSAAPAGFAPAPYRGPSAMDQTNKLLYGTEAEPGFIAKSTARQAAKEEEAKRLRGLITGQAYEGLEKALQKEEQERGVDKDQAKAMAIFKAGLAMMAGTSPNAFENIGKGAMVGVEDYQKAAADIKKAQKEHRMMMAQIEQARRAEKRGDVEQQLNALEKKTEYEERRDQFVMNALNTAGGKDADRLFEQWKINTEGGFRLGAATIGAESRENSALMRALLSGAGGEKGAMTTLQRGNVMRELENSKPVLDYVAQLRKQRGSQVTEEEIAKAKNIKIMQEFEKYYGKSGVPSAVQSGFSPQQIEALKNAGIAQYFPELKLK